MLDFDLASFYGTETKALKQAVRRNIERFPVDFMFELTRDEYNALRSQFVTLDNTGRGKYSKYKPFAFSEQGVAMLSSVLNSDTAIAINISIIRAFVAVRQLLYHPAIEIKELQNEVRELKEYIESVFSDYNDLHEDTRVQLELINEALAELQVKGKAFTQLKNQIGFNSPQYNPTKDE